MCGKEFSIYGIHIPRKSLNLCFFTRAQVPHSKLLVEFFVSPKTEGVGRSYDLLYQNSIRKYEDDLGHFFSILFHFFYIFSDFSKCDGFTILEITSVKWCGIKFISSFLQP